MKAFGAIQLTSGWEVSKYPLDIPDQSIPDSSGLDFIPAVVPGSVQYDLISAGRLENPYRSTKAAFDSAWVAKSDWLYRKSFSLNGEPLKTRRWFLHVDGIDTFSEVWLNGVLVGETRNNYRYYEFPVNPDILIAGENKLEVRVKAHDRMVVGQIEEAACLGHDSDAVEGLMGKSLIRRYQRSFFTNSSLLNLGTGVLGIGINRPVELAYFSESRITDWCFRTLSVENGTACCEILVETDGTSETDGADITDRTDHELRAVITNPVTGNEIIVFSRVTSGGKLVIPVKIDDPELWWPAGYGEPFLYQLNLELLSDGVCIYSLEKNIGFKTVELIKKLPNGRDTFHFVINGKHIWVRGQNTIPLDYIKVYTTPEEDARFFRLLENSGTNMVRIWGGGMPAGESFYDACDKLGIMLWADSFLHSNVYPDYDPVFVKEYADECFELLTHLRRHVSLCVVCGGNEQIEGWEEYGWQDKIDRFYGESLFTEVLPPIAEDLCPEIPYVINSPHGGSDCQSPVTGDSHNWGNYYNAFKDPLFVSETCWSQESYSRPETLEKFMDLCVDDYQGQGWFKRWTDLTSRARIGRLAYSNRPHGDNPCLKQYLRTLELEQARADYNALRLFRLRSPSNSGVIYWSFNKGGPLFQFGCVDYGGYPLMSYYVVKRLNRGVVSGLFRDGEEIYVAVSNQSGGSFEGKVELIHFKSDGTELTKVVKDVFLADGKSEKVFSSADLYKTVIDRTSEVFFLRLRDKSGEVIDEDTLFLCPFFEFAQNETVIKHSLKEHEEGVWELSLTADCVIMQLEIESNHKHLCSDNYFPLAPFDTKKVLVEILEKTNDEATYLKIGITGTPGLLTIKLQ